MIRIFDLFLSLVGIILLSPLFLIVIIWIIIDSRGPVIFKQNRVGRYGKEFTLYKFRSMHLNSDKTGLLTIGERDSRITRSGLFLRKNKLDELPQLVNVLKGDMSFVGPRPEVRKYVDMYTVEQKIILQDRPGITDYASIVFRNENMLLSKVENPEDYYINNIMPEKLRLNMKYISDKSIAKYFKIIILTIFNTDSINSNTLN